MQDSDPNPSVSPESLRRRHETASPSLRGIAIAGGIVVAMTVLSAAIVGWMVGAFSRTRPAEALVRTPAPIIAPDDAPLRRFPGPTLQRDPRVDLEALQQREEQQLTTYGWVDRDAGIVRIPIERAMELLLDRGLPVRETNAAIRTGKSREDLIRERATQR